LEAGTRKIGELKETIACEYLKKNGLSVIQRNYQCSRGEIDIIARDGNVTVFAEVRFRNSANYGHPLETVTWHKQKKLLATAKHFIQRHRDFADYPCRFDVLAITLNRGSNELEWIQNAFDETV